VKEEQQTNVDELIKRLPEDYERACFETKAIERKREIKNPMDLIKLVLLYLIGGYSQIEMSVIASEMGIAKLNDTAFLKRFAKCREWLSWMVSEIIPKPIVEYALPESLQGYSIAAVDASDVTEKGRSGRTFKLHYAIDLITFKCLSCKITGQKTGETLKNFSLKEKWILLADRIYGTLTSMEHCIQAKADFILRLRYAAFKLYDSSGNEIELLKKLCKVTSDIATDIEVYVKLPALGFTRLRICAVRIPDEKLENVKRRNKRKDSKKQTKTSAQALKMSEYVVVITALPAIISACDIICLYQLRWQVEIFFKRLKSIMDFGNVPLKREDSIHAWLNGKLLISLLIEQMLSEVSFSPYGDYERNTEYLERVTTSLSNAPKEFVVSV
jgi:hypothetical protein